MSDVIQLVDVKRILETKPIPQGEKKRDYKIGEKRGTD